MVEHPVPYLYPCRLTVVARGSEVTSRIFFLLYHAVVLATDGSSYRREK